MSFIVTSDPLEFAGEVADNIVARGAFNDRFEAIQDLKAADRQGLTLGVREAARGDGFFRVASLNGPLKDLLHVLDPEWMTTNKEKFYEWLDKHPQFCTYDRRNNARRPSLTHIDGKAVL